MSTKSTARAAEHFGFLLAVLIAVVLNPLNSSTIAVALRVLLHRFGNHANGLTWIISAYYLGSAIAQPILGRLGDLWGHRRLIFLGLALIMVTAVGAPLSPSLGIFVGWRVGQAVATSMIYPNAVALVRAELPDQVGRVLGWIGMAAGGAVAVGPPIGGLLMSVAGWQAIFWLNIPLAAVAGWLFYRHAPHNPPNARKHAGPRAVLTRQLDLPGLMLFAGTVVAFLIWSTHFDKSPGSLMLIVGLAGTGILIFVESRMPAPLIPLTWFKDRTFSLSSLLTILSNVVMYSILYGLPVYVQSVRHLSPSDSGLLLLAFAGVTAVASPWGGRLAQRRVGAQPLITAGIFLVAGTGILIGIKTLAWAWIVLGLIFLGFSFALSNVLLQKILLESVPPQETGRVSGLFMLLRYLGTIISSALVAAGIENPARTALFEILLVMACITAVLPLGLIGTDSFQG